MITCNLELLLALRSETAIELSRITGISVDTLCKMKNNKYYSISLKKALLVCKHYKCTLGQLYTINQNNIDANNTLEYALANFNQFEQDATKPAPIWLSSDELTFRCNLKALMLLKKVPQYKLAEDTGMQVSRIRNMQKNNVSYIRYEEIDILCNYFGCTLDSLLSLEKQ